MSTENPSHDDPDGLLLFSPKEKRILEYLTEHGPEKQATIIKYFKDHENSINDTTVKELLANLGYRRAVTTGVDGYKARLFL